MEYQIIFQCDISYFASSVWSQQKQHLIFRKHSKVNILCLHIRLLSAVLRDHASCINCSLIDKYAFWVKGKVGQANKYVTRKQSNSRLHTLLFFMKTDQMLAHIFHICIYMYIIICHFLYCSGCVILSDNSWF